MMLSAKAFWIGLPGSMNLSFTPVRRDHRNIALLVNSGPLSEAIASGRP
jgi:hypothetical protein